MDLKEDFELAAEWWRTVTRLMENPRRHLTSVILTKPASRERRKQARRSLILRSP
jgi:hypothetical protein